MKTLLGNGKPGTYILCLHLDTSIAVNIGKLGTQTFNMGHYFYVGSAFGPGGVAARCRHHINIAHKPRWHIDYLRRHCRLSCIVFNTQKKHLEHAWAKQLLDNPGLAVAIRNFGSSDCDCVTHLFYSQRQPDPQSLVVQPVDIFYSQ